MRDSVEYLGHRIDAQGIHATDSKLAAVTQAPEPTNVQELRAFLGLMNYYGKFIPNRSTLSRPLHSLRNGVNNILLLSSRLRMHWFLPMYSLIIIRCYI